MRKLGGFLASMAVAALCLFASGAEAKARPGAGDGDPFPLMCVDFSGHWRADNGTTYTISQLDCKYLRINMHWSNFEEETVSIVPDNLSRAIPGRDRSAVRHRWNSPRQGTMIESHRTFVREGFRISEVVTYELEVSAGLMLETTYRTTECLGSPGKVERDYLQQVFRRVPGGSQDAKRPGKGKRKR